MNGPFIFLKKKNKVNLFRKLKWFRIAKFCRQPKLKAIRKIMLAIIRAKTEIHVKS